MKELIEKLREFNCKIRATQFGLAIPGTSVATAGLTVATLEPLCPEGWEVSEAKNPLAGQVAKAIYISKATSDDELLEHCSSL